MTSPPLLFIDTNIWLNFYKSQTDAGVTLLQHLNQVSAHIIVTYQMEMEFKKNRQAVILESIKDLETPKAIPRPAIFSDAKATKALQNNRNKAEKFVKGMRARLAKVLEQPARYDPVYKIFQRVFHKTGSLNLTRDDKTRRIIRRKAFKRFVLGYPPRKKGDTSMGDAMNWEWIIHCAEKAKSDVIIVSRDSDYGVVSGNRAYLNDHLKQEFSERVSKKRKILLHTKLSEGLKGFPVTVTAREKEEENRLIESTKSDVGTTPAISLKALDRISKLSEEDLGLLKYRVRATLETALGIEIVEKKTKDVI